MEELMETIAEDYWEEIDGEIRLFAYYCRSCNLAHLPKTLLCSGCGAAEMERRPVSGKGTLYTHSTQYVIPAGYEGPYSVGYVDFTGGPRVFGHVRSESGSELKIGDEVRLEKAVLFQRQPSDTPVISFRFVVN